MIETLNHEFLIIKNYEKDIYLLFHWQRKHKLRKIWIKEWTTESHEEKKMRMDTKKKFERKKRKRTWEKEIKSSG